MSVRIALNNPHTHYTNLDFISGKILLNLASDATISAVIVKLEGVSRTRLAGPKAPYDQRRSQAKTESEVHKLLYKVATVFPTAEIQQRMSGNSSYTLPAGQYDYPFQFKFPFNNACTNNNSMLTNLSLSGMRVEVARDTNRHVKKALPPTISGFPDEAEIKYYVKVTVVRPQFYKENMRSFADFKFLPIEPPRPLDKQEEMFARRQQQFTKTIAQPQKKSLFRKQSTSNTASNDEKPPRFQVEARLPNPAILTCNEPIPLRILVQKLSHSSEIVFLHMLQIELMAATHVRAHELTRTERGSWVLTSKANMSMPLGSASDEPGKEWKVPNSMWNEIPLPNTIAPSFDTCNISRTYELEVRVGLLHGAPGSVKPELIVVPLRIPVKVYSGIAPPAALLDKIAAAHPKHRLENPPQPQGQPYAPPTPATPSNPNSYDMPPAPAGAYGAPSTAGDDAPPSYEDAMADDVEPIDGPRREYDTPGMPSFEDIGPVDGGRPNYNPPPPAWSPTFSGDTKSSGLARRQSERLFPESMVFSSSHSRDSSFEREYALQAPRTEDGERAMGASVVTEKQGLP